MTSEIPRVRDLDLAGAARNDPARDYDNPPYEQGDSEESGYESRDYEALSYPDRAYETTGSSLRDYGAPAYTASEGSDRATMTRSGGVLPFADETMELPIFRELESAWFREVESAPQQAAGNGLSVDEIAESGVRLPTGDTRYAEAGAQRTDFAEEETGTIYVESSPSPTGTIGGTSMAGSAIPTGRGAESVWRSPADEGWEAAAAAMDPSDGGITDGGLPRRVPMAQLVPGGVEKVTAGASRRSPDAVRGLLSAYHRGVQRGRQQSDEENDATSETSGPPSSGGREQEA